MLHNSHASYKGAWGVYPYLSSGNIIVSDMQTGLYIIDVTSGTTHTIETNLKPSIYPFLLQIRLQLLIILLITLHFTIA